MRANGTPLMYCGFIVPLKYDFVVFLVDQAYGRQDCFIGVFYWLEKVISTAFSRVSFPARALPNSRKTNKKKHKTKKNNNKTKALPNSRVCLKFKVLFKMIVGEIIVKSPGEKNTRETTKQTFRSATHITINASTIMLAIINIIIYFISSIIISSSSSTRRSG